MIINNRFHRIVIHLLSAILLSIVVTSSLMLNGCSPRKTLPTISTDDNNITKDTTTIKDANTSSEETKSNVTVRLNMKSYGDHDTEYDARIIRICPEYVIDNPPHGLYGEMEGYNDPFLLQNISGYQAVGIKVIGYISSGYEGAGGDDKYDLHWYSLEINEKLIRNMANEDHIDGVFIDECSQYPDAQSKEYLKTLSSLAHSYGLTTWGNVGEDSFDNWYFEEGGFDLMQSSEDWKNQPLSQIQKKYGNRISVTGFNETYNVNDAIKLTLDAWNKGLAYCYINTTEYTSIAPWFEEYAYRLRMAENNQ